MKNTNTKITVDARGAGSGKTRDYICPKLNEQINNNQLTLLVVSGKKLQTQYAENLQTEFNITHQFRVVNSDNTESTTVQAEVLDLMLTIPFGSVICITQQTFFNLDIESNIKRRFNLIIDEAIIPYQFPKYSAKKNQIDWTQAIRADKKEFGPYVGVQTTQDSSADGSLIKTLKKTNWVTHALTKSLTKLQAQECDALCFFQILDPHVLADWTSIHIAAAALEHTPMGDWLKTCQFEITYTHEFELITYPATLHTPADLNWSKTRRNDDADVQATYTKYVKNRNHNGNILRLPNVDDTTVFESHLLKHNPHGMNNLTDYDAITLDCALNLSKEQSKFLQMYFNVDAAKVKMYTASYLFYQSIMRTALRVQNNTRHVDVYVLDTVAAKQLKKLMKFEREVCIEGISGKKSPKADKKPAKTSTERSRERRNRKKLAAKGLTK